MLSSLWSGVSGLNAFGNALSVVGGNIANVNTVGYKTQRTHFEEVLEGVSMGNVERMFTQGAIQSSKSPTDLAIEGRGLFVLSGGAGNYYSRAGMFSLDSGNRLVNPQGLAVQGWALDGNGEMAGPQGDILLNSVNPPQPTTQFSISSNLDASASDGDTNAAVFTVYDSKGAKVTLTVDFTYDAALKQWDWAASSSSGATTSSGSISFDQNGNLVPPASNPAITVTGLSDAADDMDLEWNMVKADGTSDVTSYSAPSGITYIGQNGYPSGRLQSISLNEKGVITGVFSNGQVKQLAQVALADFPNPAGLVSVGGNLYAEAPEAGQPIVGAPMEGGKGSILAGSLEMSNVDLASEFVDMIVDQRGFQANARIITTSDELLVELVNLKR